MLIMIHVLWPTIRPKSIKSILEHWISNSTNKNIKYSFGTNSKHDLYLLKEELEGLNLNHEIINLKIDSVGVVKATNELLKHIKFENDSDIIILASDDMQAQKDWDIITINLLKNKCGCLYLHDKNNGGGCITIPIMTYSCLKKLNGIIYHKSYIHYYSDTELFDVVKELNLLIDERDFRYNGEKYYVFRHLHWGNNKRKNDKFDKNFMSNAQIDEKNYRKRKKHLNASEKIL